MQRTKDGLSRQNLVNNSEPVQTRHAVAKDISFVNGDNEVHLKAPMLKQNMKTTGLEEEDISQSMRSMSVGGGEYEHAADPATLMSIRNQMGSPTRSTH